MDTDIYRKFDKDCLKLRNYLRIAAVFVLTFGALAFPCLSFAQDEQSENTQTIYYLIQSQKEEDYWGHNWSTALDWSGGIAPSDTTSAIFTVGDGYWVRPTTEFPSGTGEGNFLYLGYKPDGETFDSGILNVKGSTTINNLVLGNGTIYQGTDNTTETIQGSMIVNGNAYITIHNNSQSDHRNFTIKSRISGDGTLNLTTNYKTATQIGIYLAPVESSGFTGKVIIDDQSRVAFDTANIFANAASVTSDGVLTLNANQTFNSFSGGGSIKFNNDAALTLNNTSNATYDGSISGAGSLTKTGAGELTISGSVTYTGDTLINSGALILENGGTLYNMTGSGNLESNGSNPLTLNYASNTTFNGVISGNSKIKITGAGDLTLSQAPNMGATDIAQGRSLILSAGGTIGSLSGKGNLTNNGSQDLTINNFSNTDYYGKITSTGKLIIKTDSWTLKINENKSIDCKDVVINKGTVVLQKKITVNNNNRFPDKGTVTINNGGTLTCIEKDSFGSGNAELTVNINGGTLNLGTANNQTFMNKTVVFTGGKIQAKEGVTSEGIDVKVGTSFTAKAATDPLATYPTVSTISVPIKLRDVNNASNPDPFNITVEENAQLIFADYIWNDNSKAMGIDKNGEGILTFDYTKHSSRKYSRPITVSEGVLELKNGALATDGTIQVIKTSNDGNIMKGTLELFVDENDVKNMTIAAANKIFGTGEIKKTGDGALKILTAANGCVSAESLVVSSGRLDAKGYINSKLSVAADAMLSPGNSIGSLWIEDFTIGDVTYSGELILNETGSKLLMEIGGPNIIDNDLLVVSSGNLTLHDGSIIQLAATDDCTLGNGDTFTAVLSGSNSAALAADDFIGKYVRSTDFIDLQYIQLNGTQYGTNNGKYAITGRRYIDPNAVPEPSTWALLILGVAGLLYLRTRKNKKLGRIGGDSRLA